MQRKLIDMAICLMALLAGICVLGCSYQAVASDGTGDAYADSVGDFFLALCVCSAAVAIFQAGKAASEFVSSLQDKHLDEA